VARLRGPGGVVGAAATYGVVIALGSAAAPNRPPLIATGLAATIVAAVYGLALRGMMIASRPRAAGGRGSPMTRRRALVRAAGAVVTMLGAGTALGTLLEPARRRARTFALRAPDRPARTSTRDRLPAIAGRPAEVTPAAEHYVVDIDLVDPALDARDWALEIGGEVDRPLRLGVEALQRTFTLVEQISVLTCISNEVGGPLVGSSRWTGVRLADLLQRAEVRPGADAIVFRCADGYTSALRLEQARSAEVLVAIAQDGRPLTSAHGFPCRLRVPAGRSP